MKTKPKKDIEQTHFVKSYGFKAVEESERIANDVSELIDNGESREILRIAVAYWAEVASVEAGRRASLESKLDILKSAKQLIESIIV